MKRLFKGDLNGKFVGLLRLIILFKVYEFLYILNKKYWFYGKSFVYNVNLLYLKIYYVYCVFCMYERIFCGLKVCCECF